MLTRTSLRRSPVRSAAQPNSTWKPPPSELMKINVDAGLSNSGVGASVAVCSDSEGLFLGSSALLTPGVTDPVVLEAIACSEALALA